MAAVIDLLKSADFAFGNLETPVSEGGEPIEKWVNMRHAPGTAWRRDGHGFSSADTGEQSHDGFRRVCFRRYLDPLLPAQFDLCRRRDWILILAWEAKILRKGEIDVAFLGASSTLGPLSAAGSNRAGVAPIHVSESYHVDPAASMEQPGSAPYVHTRAWQEDIDRAVAAIDNVLYDVDLIVVAMHWGVPPFWRPRFQDGLADYQIEVGHALIDAGADVIVGHHPHSLQEVEIYRGKPIFYSLGNFRISQQPGSGERYDCQPKCALWYADRSEAQS